MDEARPIAGAATRRETIPLRPIIVASIAAFGALWLLQSLAAWVDLERRGGAGTFGSLLTENAFFYPPWIAFSVVLFAAIDRRSDRLDRARTAATLFLAASLLFFVPYVVYEAVLSLLSEGKPLADLPQRLRNWPPFFLFVDFVLLCGCFASLYALGVVRAQLARERHRRELESQMLSLRLELEQQRLASIRAQLEPHFLFNALNAISALVRSEERATALSALSRLSGLLRYALTASRLDRVTLRDELDFVRDYLELQRLRYGARLNASVAIDDETLLELSCPPLLLQPLVENALRHDLDAHDGASDVAIHIGRSRGGASITISNPLRNAPSPNAGFGLGIGATRERLTLRYGEEASLTTVERDGRFEVELRLPEASDA
ncbi:MAG: sensor histidine kinase [Thermoanaerobaculia bacterium]